MTLTNQQKGLVAVLLLVSAALAWQVYHTFDLGHDPVRPTVNFASQIAKPMTVNEGYLAVDMVSLTQTPATLGQRVALKPLSPQQMHYLELVNEYKVTEVKRMIAKENEAIAQSTANATRASIETRTLLAKAGFPAEQIALKAQKLPPLDMSSQDYQLVFAGKQNGLWMATIRDHGHLVDVMPGTELEDHVRVAHIDHGKVVLTRDTHKHVLTFAEVTAPQAAVEAASASATVVAAPVAAAKPIAAPIVTAANAQPKASAQPAKPVKATKAESAVIANPPAVRPVQASSTPIQKPVTSQKLPTTVTAVEQPRKNVSLATLAQASNVARTATTHKVITNPITRAPELVPVVKTTANKASAVPAVATPAPIANNSSATRNYNKIEATLLAAPADAVTIQLLANTQLSEVKQFIERNHLQNKVNYYQTALHGLPVYVVVYNQYPTQEAALHAIATLPIGMQRFLPFPKSMSAVHEELHRKV